MNIGSNIKKERNLKNLSQAELANALNISQDTVSLWELNKRVPAIEDIIKLANFFNLSIEELLDLKKDKNGNYIY